MVAAEAGLAVRQCLETLSAVQRHAIELAYWEGLTQRQIAEKMSAPLGTVRGSETPFTTMTLPAVSSSGGWTLMMEGPPEAAGG